MSNSVVNLAEKEPNSSDDELPPNHPRKKKLFNYLQFRPDVYITKESVGFRNYRLGPEEVGLFDPDEDLWLQWHTDGIKNPKKRKFFIRELPADIFQYRREEAHHKLRELEENLLNGFENAAAGFSDPFQHVREEYKKTRWDRIKNISDDDDERIQRIENLCRNVAQVYDEQGYVVLKKSGEHTPPKVDEVYPRVFTHKHPRKGL